MRHTTLGELSKRGALEFSDGYRTKQSELSGSGYRILRAGDIREGTPHFDGPDFVDAAFAPHIGRKFAQAGDVVLTTKGTVGRTAFVAEAPELVTYSPQLCYFRPDSEVLEPRYFYYWFNSREFRSQALSMQSSTDMAPYISLSQLNSASISLPDLAEQRAIAEVLGALDDKIAANSKLASTLAELSQAVFMSFCQRATATRPLAELASTQYGITKSASEAGSHRFVRVTDINKNPWITWDTTPFVSDLSPAEVEKYQVHPGDLLAARMADPGKVGLIEAGDPPAVFASYLVRVRPTRDLHPLYLFHFMRSPRYQNYAAAASSGSVQKNMNAKVIVGIDVPLPSPTDQTDFAQAAEPLHALQALTLRESATLAALRDTLLPALMDGTVRVRDAVAQAEGVL